MAALLLGGFGQLGTALQARLGERAVSLARRDADLRDRDQLERAFDRWKPDCVINCAAYNFVDRAETEPQPALDVNVVGVKRLAGLCEARGLPLVQISSDHVFGGDAARRTPYTEEDPTAPVSVYGRSKRDGEKFATHVCSRHFVVRTCGLYGTRRSPGKGSFVDTILRLAASQPVLKVVDDQICAPTSAADLAAAIVDLLETEAYGIYHATSGGEVSWYQFAAEIVRIRGLAARVEPVTTQEFGATAPRPAYSILDGRKLARLRGCELPDWRSALEKFLSGSEKI